jgi:hypothetical protein
MKVIGLVMLVVTSTVFHSVHGMDRLKRFSTTDTTAPVLLPVHWLNFYAIQKERSIILEWSTLHEQGIKQFIIERSIVGNDFVEVGRVAANGNSSTFMQYKYEDLQPVTGNSYYRVTCEDENGFNTISLIRKVNFKTGGSAAPLELRNIYVNRKTIHLTPIFHIGEKSTVYLFTRAGRLALTAAINSQTTKIEASALKGGIYFLSTGYTTSPVIIGN